MDIDKSSTSDSSLDVLSLPACRLEEELSRTCTGRSDQELHQSEQARIDEFTVAAERYRAQFLRLAVRMVGPGEEAHDVVQDALLKAFVNLSKFRSESKMTTWLCAIVRNTALEAIRTKRQRVFVPIEGTSVHEEEQNDLNLVDAGMNAEERYELQERRELVSAILGSMSDSGRRVFEMCVLEERPQLQVATVLNLSLSKVKSRMFRARRALRREISKRLRQA